MATSPCIPGLFGAPLTPLDPLETAVPATTASPSVEEPPPLLALTNNFRHSGWKDDRQRVFQALLAVQASPHRVYGFADCGASFWILRHKRDPTRFKTVPDHCHDRFCVPCAGTRQTLIRHNLTRYLKPEPHRFLTLTVRNNREPLADLIQHLYRSFRRLRHRRLWKERVRGGAAFLEITWNEERESWNPHLHCILEGHYIDRPELSRLWLAATGDSTNLHLRFIRTPQAVTHYITKYATKPLPSSVLHRPEQLEEAIRALIGRRTILTFGTWTRWKLLHDEADQDWCNFGHFREIDLKAIMGDSLCENILSMLPLRDPHTHEFIVDLEHFP